MTDNLIIFDTTLRDGEQALQASLSSREKLQIALAIERLGVDIIEAGFPVSSPGDLESVRLIGQHIKDSRVAGLSRAIKGDIDAVNEALKDAVAGSFRIHTFIATSDIHVESKLRMGFDKVLEMTHDAVKHARNYTDAMIERFGFGHDSHIIEIASNDGYLLQYFKEKKITHRLPTRLNHSSE